MTFSYLVNKIMTAEFVQVPFSHIEINDFFSSEHFEKIVHSEGIKIPEQKNTAQLYNHLKDLNYQEINFPGCTTSIDQYLEWESGKTKRHTNVDTCEGFGMVLRLQKYNNSFLEKVSQFLSSEEFINALCEKFSIERQGVFYDFGVQKYLNGYEISPHPDVRSKALTFMINANPYVNSESLDYHTHYLELIETKKYVQEFWKYNVEYDRCWIPWEWCNTVKKQITNNSIVIFAPNYDTLHAVKATYNHLETQRTQFYGNLWFSQGTMAGYVDSKSQDNTSNNKPLPQLPWQAYVIDERFGEKMIYESKNSQNIFQKIKNKFLPRSIQV
jgi:hypothetical protein